ncbi:polysaccharide pyruvyl transferase family protein [Agaribacter marinus]|uniref:Polysaccharide pyruvyl transferase family protein n=1 Tax=Virgibacillus salarius TaxID=447199 RepID=A0A941DYN1_9BACI|nr:polysaccharide pyruvyl transferase family protein [Virgibacillus salarius]MBR7795788.1 polysaccharide pyruvyl transferase family protein [Virgibacillus salarius]NAZ08501.1 polysaccharide pyruvyl transferase family protein [Agaribacter marinus]
MKNIIIRSGMSPLDTFDASYIMGNNSIGGNVGNLVYQYSVIRTLMTEGTSITPDYYNYDPNRADEINEKFDCYIIPLADAFRKDFIPTLKKYTRLIKKLTIPVVVIGVGLRAPFEPKLDEGFPFDEDVKDFVKAVLEKSNMIGVRGEITSKYLSRLGFREGIDHTVIGCPSMYTFGRELKIRDTNITKESMVCVNSSRLSPNHVLDFISRSMKDFPNHYFIPQWMKEMKLVYNGAPPIAKQSSNYPVKMSDPVYMNNRVRFFLNVPTWLDFISRADLSFGARLHGNITATIAGTPSLLIPKDARMRELAEYHNLTHVWANDITKDTRLSDLIEKSDFHLPEKKQGVNFDHFINFLNKNDLDHIYKDSMSPSVIPLDLELSKKELLPPIYPISGCSMEEMVMRLETYYPQQEEKSNKVQKELKAKIAKKDKTINKLNATLNRKSVRLALKTANMFRI